MVVDFTTAPPPTVVDGLVAVPVHVEGLRAHVRLDGSTSTARVDVTMMYVVGPTPGSPIFDLRQEVDRCWLDDRLIEPDLVRPRDVGEGLFGSIRVLQAVQAAGSSHTLRFQYRMATPRSQLDGTYPPALEWYAGPRLRWSFGMADLYAGRYLEAWLPSNLQFDQFPIELTIRIAGTAVPHTVISNGTVVAIDDNAWSVQFPPWFTSMSPMLEVRAADAVERACVTVQLRSSSVVVVVWKLVTDPTSLAEQLELIAMLLAGNETSFGAYPGDRFVCFLHGASGGMEYALGATTSVSALRHEVLHSWFARGLSPASQADAWWDEAFTRLNDNTSDRVQHFDYRERAVELCSRRPFQRRTAPNSYTDGCRFFLGVAATLGADRLRVLMRELHESRFRTTVSTPYLESHLITRSGDVTLVDAFHRFVYGFDDPTPSPRLWFRNTVDHDYFDVWTGAHCDSPDLWITHTNDAGRSHQSPRPCADNWLHARVRNHRTGGDCRHFVVTFAVAGANGHPFCYPDDFFPCIATAVGFQLAPGSSQVVSARWPADAVPTGGGKLSLLAAVHSRRCHPSEWSHVWNQVSLVQKNLT
ncbi:hypothetical protein SAMN05444580_102428 [Rhodococcus tukisamuensis]|uniref:Peptidase M1 membrane alanine aminopeptidase domain-containing protein n=2 Tax=Rhodococcus tukisamuensis TaxID=168276 RepID=A0A1G6REN7_9NOCA|nr:hypothetical protein SAMN05444580_102428 [Rhodococcus tukisamuensis]